MKKIEALGKYLNIEVSVIKEGYDENFFETGEKEYLVLTDDEADVKAKEYILDSVWAFTPNFIMEHSEVLDFDTASENVVKAISDQCESGNEPMKKLIDNLEEFVEDAISADGRGHFLNTYDGEENEQDEYFIYRIN